MIKISISAVRLHHTYLASVERIVPQLFSIFLISRSLYFYLIIIKVFIFYLIIIKVFIPDIKVFIFLSHHHHHLFLHTRSYAALRAADLDWIVGPGYSLGAGTFWRKTMKNQPGTMKNHGNQPKTMKLP